MKKIALFPVLAMAVALASCDDMLPNPEIQQNPELDLFAADGLEISQDNFGTTTPIDLQELADLGLQAQLAEITKLENFPATSTLTFGVEVSMTADFAKTATIELTPEGNAVLVPTATLNSAIYDNFTRTPGEYTLYTRWAAYAVDGNSSMRIGGADKYYGQYAYKIKTFKPARVLADSYVLRYRTSSGAAWQTMPMVKDNASATSYDDGGFTALVDVTAPGFEWTVMPTSDLGTGTQGIIGVAADAATALSGKLVESDDAAAQIIDAKASVTIAVDVFALTYGVVPSAVSEIYIASASTSLSDFTKMHTLSTGDFNEFTGTAPLGGKWYMAAQAADEGLFFMPASYTVANGNLRGALTMAFKPAGHETFDIEKGLYIIKAKFSDMAVEAILVPVISAIGQFNGWNTGTAVDLKPNADFSVWTVKDLEVKDAGGFKFCVNHDWAYSFGGSVDNIVQNGGDLNLAETGKYDITLDFSRQPATCTIVKK